MYGGNSWSRFCFVFMIFLYWIQGIAIICFSLWFLIDPMRTYALNLVDFSEDDPLLKFAIFAILAVALLTLFVGIIGCMGALKFERCLLASFIFFVLVTFVAKWATAAMAYTYKEKFPGNRMTVYLANISQNRYSRDKWVLPLMDSVQFYQQCCGGNGPQDYFNSFWYITNTERGTRSFVPRSCCRQTQSGRAWSLHPIDPMCTTYGYYTKSFNDSVNIQGCGNPMKEWTYNQVYMFIGVSIGSSFIDLLCIIAAATFMCKILGYSFIYN